MIGGVQSFSVLVGIVEATVIRVECIVKTMDARHRVLIMVKLVLLEKTVGVLAVLMLKEQDDGMIVKVDV